VSTFKLLATVWAARNVPAAASAKPAGAVMARSAGEGYEG
jgi:hypothetical protein